MELQFDDLESKKGFFVTKKPDKPTFLPEPERRRRLRPARPRVRRGCASAVASP